MRNFLIVAGLAVAVYTGYLALTTVRIVAETWVARYTDAFVAAGL